MFLNVSAEGKLSLTFGVSSKQGITYTKEQGYNFIFDTGTDMPSIKLSGSVTPSINMGVSLNFLLFNLLEADASAGLKIKGNMNLTAPFCANANIQPYVSFGLGASLIGDLLNKPSDTKDFTVLDWHFENFKRVEECTTGAIIIPDIASKPVLAVGDSHTLALKSDGTVWGWGFGKYGYLGNTSVREYTSKPVQAMNVNNIIAIATGRCHSLAQKNDGTVWAWGRNSDGELGDGTTTERYTAVQVQGLNDVISIAGAGSHSLALKNDGTVWAWGRNAFGQLGDSTFTDRNTPVQVQNLGDVIAIAGGSENSFALKNDGTVWAWGHNGWGQLGTNTSADRSNMPVQVQNLSNIIAIAGGYSHCLALKNDATVWTWGYNGSGQLGDGTFNIGRSTPAQVPNLNGVIAIAGGNHSLALKSDGTVWAWGYNGDGQLGNRPNTSRPTPIQVQNLSHVVALGKGSSDICVALKSDGSVWSWGYFDYGQSGISDDGTLYARFVPWQVSNSTGDGYFNVN